MQGGKSSRSVDSCVCSELFRPQNGVLPQREPLKVLLDGHILWNTIGRMSNKIMRAAVLQNIQKMGVIYNPHPLLY